ncbi:hypothetical protein JTB14_020528 [Gonioctena quinquepunctata]|nr:hypothetical protein JTB14_020528 [Gonioctena quinquepunctata]
MSGHYSVSSASRAEQGAAGYDIHSANVPNAPPYNIPRWMFCFVVLPRLFPMFKWRMSRRTSRNDETFCVFIVDVMLRLEETECLSRGLRRSLLSEAECLGGLRAFTLSYLLS